MDGNQKITKITPLEKPLNKPAGNKGVFKHTATKVKLENGKSYVLESGKSYGDKLGYKSNKEFVYTEYNKADWVK